MQKTINIIVLGDKNSGKSTFISKAKEYFREGVLFSEISSFEFQRDYANLDEVYRNCDFAIVLFDISSSGGYEDSMFWISDIRRVNVKVPIFIIGNKIDLGLGISDPSVIKDICNTKFFYTSTESSLIVKLFDNLKNFIEKF
jgi:GTPase SAR1 family protein